MSARAGGYTCCLWLLLAAAGCKNASPTPPVSPGISRAIPEQPTGLSIWSHDNVITIFAHEPAARYIILQGSDDLRQWSNISTSVFGVMAVDKINMEVFSGPITREKRFFRLAVEMTNRVR